MGVTVSAGAVEQRQSRDECARNWGLPRRQSSMIHQTWLPNAPAFETNGVAAAADAAGRGGRPWIQPGGPAVLTGVLGTHRVYRCGGGNSLHTLS